MKRTKHSLSNYRLATFDMGELVPVGHLEVLPGDSIRLATSALIRLSPLMTPVMHPVNVRIHHWFVPYRLLWDGWEDFITGGPDGANSATVPTFTNYNLAGSLSDYFGVPNDYTGPWVQFPILAYNKIWNEFYRDQDLQSEVPLDSIYLRRVAWEKDYFTAARPWTQKGPEVTIPLGTSAPVVGSGVPYFDFGGVTTSIASKTSDDDIKTSLNTPASTQMQWASPTALSADLSNATAASVNDLRLAFALQRYQEARAQYGSRYTEYLRYLGVRSSDARLQRPEYIGGGKSTISFSEILRTGGNAETDGPVGEMKGHGIAALRTRRAIRFFEEHGIVISLASIRPRSIYSDNVRRDFLRRTKEDYWQKELEQIGQQEVFNAEVYGKHSAPTGVFGYQDRYSEYRHIPSEVTGDFRTTLNDWHLARQFSSDPALNATFVECNPSKRIFAEQTQDAIWAMFSHSIQARRMVGKKTIGRIV